MAMLPFRFLIGNAYYLQEEAARGRVDRVDEVLTKLVGLGVTVVRTWAFNDDPSKDGAIRRACSGRGLSGMEEVGLRGLDLVLARAAHFGLRLIMPLVNYWSAYGGTAQWCRWVLGDGREGDPRFFTDLGVRSAWFAHVEQLLDRRNPLTGLRYGEDRVVLAWELMNEPRGAGLTEDEFHRWVAEAAKVVRGRAGQLLSLGDEGHERSFAGYEASFWRRAGAGHLFSSEQGASFSRTLEQDLDLASIHFYPEKYGIAPGLEREAGVRWMAEHEALARAAGRSLYVGEFGLGNERSEFGRFTLPERRAVYRTWLAAADRLAIAGIGPWLFAHDDRPDAWDDFTFYCRSGAPIGSRENRYADLLRDAADALQASGVPPPSK